MRHTLAILLRKPITKPFAMNSKMIKIQVHHDPIAELDSDVHLDDDEFESLEEKLLKKMTDKLFSTQGVTRAGNPSSLDQFRQLPFF